MAAKALRIEPIRAQLANGFVQRVHYSGTVGPNSQLHLGVYWDGRLEGCLQFGPPMDRRKVLPIVAGTPWAGMIELNRMAFTEALPRNSESRALAVALRILRRQAPQLKWVLSFADATQSGDGAIYRAVGFVLTGIRRNATIGSLDGKVSANISHHVARFTTTKGPGILDRGGAARVPPGWKPLPGYQLRYVYFLDPAWRDRLAVPAIPYAEIAARGIGMYRGQPIARAGSTAGGAAPVQGEEGGSTPTPALPPRRRAARRPRSAKAGAG